MCLPIVREISQRLSLRKPQLESLELLSKCCRHLSLKKDVVLDDELQRVKDVLPDSFTSFERNFPSLCFALATGVGKTRLMGAFIAYLSQQHGLKNFLVLAPNLTIYNKLIQDFTGNSPKYVFKGIGELTTQPPKLVTGENYTNSFTPWFNNPITINVFNIAKITEKGGGEHLNKSDENKNIPRFRRAYESLGESYFDYLQRQEDLVIIMDESHRYRASAGMKAINDLHPVLGLELTATPQIQKGIKKIPFKNTVYNYPLGNAILDGFVKKVCVATKPNFNAKEYTTEEIEKIKLEDGLRLHAITRTELAVYAHNNKVDPVKPFVLVIAKDINHADKIKELLESDEIENGSYLGKVLTINSKTVTDDVINQLLTLESPSNKFEIVIHVNMLSEGWDVTNLYTIIPLRTAGSLTLVEQSIGRGLRLPYGKRTGIDKIDRLSIVFHDKFDEIVNASKDVNSPLSKLQPTFINLNSTEEAPSYIVTSEPCFTPHLKEEAVSVNDSNSAQRLFFDTNKEVILAEMTLEAIDHLSQATNFQELTNPNIQKKLIENIKKNITFNPKINYLAERDQEPGFDFYKKENDDLIKQVVFKTTREFQRKSIAIPHIVLLPKNEIYATYEDFTPDFSNLTRLETPEASLLLREIGPTDKTEIIELPDMKINKQGKKSIDLIVVDLMDKNEVDYDASADLLYKLAQATLDYLKTYIPEENIFKIVSTYHKYLADFLFEQMKTHFSVKPIEYEATITKGFSLLRSSKYTTSEQQPRPFNQSIPAGERSKIKQFVFSGFSQCIEVFQKFDSESERQFSEIIDRSPEVLKWLKPAKKSFQIRYNQDNTYEPDFVVETKSDKYLCEPKAENMMENEEVKQKAKAATKWCQLANELTQNESNYKPWHYLLIPHTEIKSNSSFDYLAKCYERQ